MLLLGIESSCDETAAAVVEDGRKIVSSVIASQVEEHKIYGGVVPEIASRRHSEAIVRGGPARPWRRAGITLAELDAVAVTLCPWADRGPAGGGELRQGPGPGRGQAPDAGPPSAGAYCRQLPDQSGSGAALSLPGGLAEATAILSRCEDYTNLQDPGPHPGRRGGRGL